MTDVLDRVGVAQEHEAATAESGAERRAPGPLSAPSSSAPVKITRQMLRRRALPIRSYVGANGSGKTATAILDLLPSIYAGRPILSTVPIIDHRTGQLYEGYIKFDSWSYLLDDRFRGADVLMDEVTGIANARASQSMPIQVQSMLDKLRKRDLTLSWTAPSWGRADTTIRTTTLAVTLCRSYFPNRGIAKAMGTEVPAWLPRRLFRVRTFDALGFEDFNRARAEGNTRSKPLRAECVEWWWGPGRMPLPGVSGFPQVFSSYSTMDSVSRVGEVLDSGNCAHCGGTRTRPKCSCD